MTDERDKRQQALATLLGLSIEEAREFEASIWREQLERHPVMRTMIARAALERAGLHDWAETIT